MDDRHVTIREMANHSFDRHRRDETQIGRARHCVPCFGFELLALLMQVDFHGAETQSFAAITEADGLHTHHFGVKANSCLHVGTRQHEMVK